MAAFGLDVLWPIFLLAGIEVVRVHPGDTAFTPLEFVSYPWTHSLAMSALWGALAAAVTYARLQSGRAAGVIAAVVVSHWVLDFVTHRPDLPLWPGGPMQGLGLWNSTAGTIAVEGALFAGGLALYLRSSRATDRTGRIALWALILLVGGIWLSGPFSPPPPGPTAIAVAGLLFAVMMLPWTMWIERHRVAAAVVLVCFLGPVATVRAQTTPAEDVGKSAQAVVELLAKQDYAAVVARFDAAMKGAMPEDQLRRTWVGLMQQVGAFNRQTGVRTQAQGTYRIALVTCEFARGTYDLQIVFDTAGLIAGLSVRTATPTTTYSPPAYAATGSYTEQEISVGSGEWVLPGTLTMPAGAGPFPAVVLVHGSGPGDRDSTVGGAKPFRDLALGLAARGIAVVRYDKRSRVHTAKLTGLPGLTVKDETIDDALAAVALLRGTPSIDPAKVFVLGHSLGGMLVPRMGAADAKIAGFIVMAGAVRSLETAMLDQTRYLSMADGTVTAEEQAAIARLEQLVETVKTLGPAEAAKPDLLAGAPASYWIDLRGYDPPASAASLTMPLLILQGERDYQVTMEDFARWRAALGARSTVTFKSYPALNHLFVSGTGKSLPGEYALPGHVDEAVIRDIAAWILARR
jgi:dienelactone hydrolase